MSKGYDNSIIEEIKSKIPFPELFRELYPDHYRATGNSLCPIHDDSNASFQLNQTSGWCHAGCTQSITGDKSFRIFDLWMNCHSCDFKTALKALAEKADVRLPQKRSNTLGPELGRWNYTDKHGTLIFQNRKFRVWDKDGQPDKTFRQCRPDPDRPGEWIWKLDGCQRVLYRLPDILQAQVIWFVEGEKDTDNLVSLGLEATTSPQGADNKGSKWPKLCRDHHIHEPLQGKTVYILNDNDKPGREHAEAVARSLYGVAQSIKLLNLKKIWPEIPHKGDVSDFIERFGPEEAKRLLLELAESTPEYEPPASENGEDSTDCTFPSIPAEDDPTYAPFYALARKLQAEGQECGPISNALLAESDQRGAGIDGATLQSIAESVCGVGENPRIVRARRLEAAQIRIRELLSNPDKIKDTLFDQENVTALAILRDDDPKLYCDVKDLIPGRVKLLENEIKKARSHLKLVVSNSVPVQTDKNQGFHSVITDALSRYREAQCSPNYVEIAELVFEWLKGQGARFFVNQHKSPFMVWGHQIYWVNSSDRDEREAFEAMLCKQGGLLQSSREGKAMSEALRHIAVSESPTLKEVSWLHTDHASAAVFVNLNNENNEIARISPAGVELLTNGDNDYSVFLAMSERMSPLHYVLGVAPARGAALIKECLIEQFPLARQDGYMCILWLICAFLMDFSGTIPLVRVEGDSGAAKTDVEKLPSVLVYGQPEYSKATPASLWANAARDLLICCDNVEISQESPDLIDFLLLVAIKASREKRRTGTDSGVIKERPRCLVMTDGIEPLGAGLTEISSRTLIFRASEEFHRGGFSSEDVEQALIAHRDEIMSWVFDTTSRVLALIKDRAHIKAKVLLDKTLKKHNKKRCHEYFALMYLVAIADGTPDEIDLKLATLDPNFCNWIKAQSVEAVAAGGEGHQIGAVLSTILSQWQHARLGNDADREVFRTKYPTLSMDDEGIHKTTTRDLFVALRTVAKDKSLPFTIQSALQLGRRLGTDREAIEAAGFDVTMYDLKDRFRGYSITKRG